MRVAQRWKMKIPVARDAARQALPLADARALRLLIERIEGTQLPMQQVAKVKRSPPRPFLRRGRVRIKPTPPLRFPPRHQRPADLLRVSEDAGLDGFVFGRLAHRGR